MHTPATTHPLLTIAAVAPTDYAASPSQGPLRWDTRHAAHLLVDGRVGSGKTTLLQHLAKRATESAWIVQVLDPALDGTLHDTGRDRWHGAQVAASGSERVMMLHEIAWLVDERLTTAAEAEKAGRTTPTFAPLLLILDSVEILELGGAGLCVIDTILARGHDVDVHLAVAALHPEPHPETALASPTAYGARVTLAPAPLGETPGVGVFDVSPVGPMAAQVDLDDNTTAHAHL